MMESGRYVYVDSHLVLNHSKYIDNSYGIAFMTELPRGEVVLSLPRHIIAKRRRKLKAHTHGKNGADIRVIFSRPRPHMSIMRLIGLSMMLPPTPRSSKHMWSRPPASWANPTLKIGWLEKNHVILDNGLNPRLVSISLHS